MVKPFTTFLLTLFLVSCLFSAVHFGISFMNEIHTIDLSYNMCLISNDLKVYGCVHDGNINYREWSDQLTSGQQVRYFDGYINATDRLIVNFIRFGLSCFGLGLFSTIITWEIMIKQEKIDLLEKQNKKNDNMGNSKKKT
jgi:hypothetical protein